MFIPGWGMAVIILLIIYLLIVDLKLHGRLEVLEKALRNLEGPDESEGSGVHTEEHESDIG